MKRGKPLRRTPLKRGTSNLRRTELNQRSKKTENLYVERRALVKEMLNSHNFCEACKIFYVFDLIAEAESKNIQVSFGVVNVNKTRDIHELVNRSQGGSITHRPNLLAVCRPCHTRITTNPKEAERLGLHLESWCNSSEGFSEAERVRHEWARGNPTQPYWFSTE